MPPKHMGGFLLDPPLEIRIPIRNSPTMARNYTFSSGDVTPDVVQIDSPDFTKSESGGGLDATGSEFVP